MALRKKIATPLGIEAEIWDIIRFEWKKNGDSTVALYGWYDEESMNDNRQPLDTRVLYFSFPIFPYLSDVYNKIKESRLENKLITPEIPATYDEEGNELTPLIPAIYEDIETNEFAGATRT